MKSYLFLMCAGLMILACGNKQSQQSTSPATEQPGDTGKIYRSLSPEEFSEQMNKEQGVLIDVRTPGEYRKGFIAGAILMDIFSDDFDQNLAKLDQSKTYYVYCAKGGRSEECSDKMMALGFKRVYNLDGGISAWEKKALPVQHQ